MQITILMAVQMRQKSRIGNLFYILQYPKYFSMICYFYPFLLRLYIPVS